MSNTAELHPMYSQPSQNTINSHIRLHQPTSKLISTYLSTAVQYLNRTKSFHVPLNTSTVKDKNLNDSISVIKHSQRQHSFMDKCDLAQSIPSSISNSNSPSPIHSLPQTPTIGREPRVHSSKLSNINYNYSDNNKMQGFVHTLRRSLKRNKERFYNKRSATMKSCNSLSNYDDSTNSIRTPVAMTPTLLLRHKYLENNTNTCTTIVEDNLNSTSSINHNRNNDDADMDEKCEVDEQLPPLQPVILNGRHRIITQNSIPSPPLTVQYQPSVINISSVTSSPSSTPITSNIIESSPIDIVQQQQSKTNSDIDEKERLKNDLIQLKTELQKSKETIARLQKSEEQMRERLAEQAQRQLEKCGKFEDLNQASRPTELIRSYGTLYSQARIDALDALDNISEISDADDLKSKLLFSVVVLAFRFAQNQAKDIRGKIKQILQLSNDKSSIVLEETIEKYLRTTIQKYDIGKITAEVENQLWATLYDYPRLKSCNELLKYIQTACRTAWGLVNQTPPYYIEFQATKYDKQIHERFHTSDNESEIIIEYIWPCLIDGRDRACVARGVVVTDGRHSSVLKHPSS